jgi:lipopolysaccharide biosynthesis glycosyltransferase
MSHPTYDKKNLPQKNAIHIGIAFDQNYLLPFHALLNSILANNSDLKINFYLIVSGINEKEKTTIKNRIVESGGAVEFYDPDLMQLKNLVLSGTWTSSVYYRLLFPLLIPDEVNTFLYLDCDIIVLKSLHELYNSDLSEYPLAAVSDSYVPTQPLIGITEPGEYFNSGVLLINVKKWNKQQISQKTLAYLEAFPERIKFVDQCGLNAVLKNNWAKLSIRFNLLFSSIPSDISARELKIFLQDKVVIHFTLQRPWNMLCRNRLRNLYFDYLRRSHRVMFSFLAYADFSFKKLPAWFKIRIVEFYIDTPILRTIRQLMK